MFIEEGISIINRRSKDITINGTRKLCNRFADYNVLINDSGKKWIKCCKFSLIQWNNGSSR